MTQLGLTFIIFKFFPNFFSFYFLLSSFFSFFSLWLVRSLKVADCDLHHGPYLALLISKRSHPGTSKASLASHRQRWPLPCYGHIEIKVGLWYLVVARCNGAALHPYCVVLLCEERETTEIGRRVLVVDFRVSIRTNRFFLGWEDA